MSPAQVCFGKLLGILLLVSCVWALSATQAGYHVPDPGHLSKAKDLLQQFQLIDTHVDTPQVFRVMSRQPHDMIETMATGFPGHFDIPRAREGGVGGVFFTVWSPCQDQIGVDVGPDFLNPDDTVRDVLEQFDLISGIVEQNNQTFSLATTAEEMENAFSEGKIGVMLGMEGSHMLGNSLATMRIYASLGVRYLTLTHVCHSAFASSAGGGAGTDGSALKPVHAGNGLTDFGRALVLELNRLGVMVDLSHVTPQTMQDVLDITRSPVLFSHSATRALYDHPRNIPDSVLERIGSKPGQNPGVIHSILTDLFMGPGNATIDTVVDHVEYIAHMCGKAHVGLGSDFDGMPSTVKGIDGVEDWPKLIAEFVRRGWTDDEIHGLVSGNLRRVMGENEQVKRTLVAELPSRVIYEKRTDLPAPTWGGPSGAYLPPKVREMVFHRRHDEL
ncbi:hypothetical protein JCM24511_03728 [Saitozyma sp. JCM 24511]|nr:hypothetical protein JCM24511_03728 [Saitozyma sp. JCM 24511]